MANRPALLRFLRARGGGDDAEDLAQGLWLKVSSGRDTGPIAEPLSYLYRMADNMMLDRRRSVQRRGRRDLDWSSTLAGAVPDATDAPSADRILVARERLRTVEAALDRLGERTSTIFRRFRLDGIGQRDIAAEQGVTLSAVEKHLQKAYRAMIEVQRLLDAEPGSTRRPDTERANDVTG